MITTESETLKCAHVDLLTIAKGGGEKTWASLARRGHHCPVGAVEATNWTSVGNTFVGNI